MQGHNDSVKPEGAVQPGGQGEPKFTFEPVGAVAERVRKVIERGGDYGPSKVTAPEYSDAQKRVESIIREAITSDRTTCAAALQAEIDTYKFDLERTTDRLVAAKRELACPECGCADEQDAASKECGCDSLICARDGKKTLAEDYLHACREICRLRAEIENLQEKHVAMNARAISCDARDRLWRHALRAKLEETCEERGWGINCNKIHTAAIVVINRLEYPDAVPGAKTGGAA